MKAGVPVAARFFPPMYDLAAPMHIVSTLGGTVAGFIQWFLADNILWAIGAALLLFVIPFTLVVVAIDIMRFRSDWLNDLVRSVFGSMMRESEMPPTGSRPVLIGAKRIFLKE